VTEFGDFHVKSGCQLMGELLALGEPPTCVFISNEFMHAGSTRFLLEKKENASQVPSIISFGAMELSFGLGCCRMVVRQPITAIGTQAAGFLLSRIAGETGAPRMAG